MIIIKPKQFLPLASEVQYVFEVDLGGAGLHLVVLISAVAHAALAAVYFNIIAHAEISLIWSR